MDNDEKMVLMVASVFATGAVALILYQHATATNTVINAVNAGQAPALGQLQPGGSQDYSSLGTPASLGGMPSPGQSNLVPDIPAVSPIQVDANYVAGPNGLGGTYGIGPASFMYQPALTNQ